MKKIFAVIFLLLCLQNVVRAQQIEVFGVDEDLSDLSARVHERKDGNGDPCALVKVMFPVEGAKFGGDIVGDVKYDTGVYWVYMIVGSKKITISHPQYIAATLDFSKYSINGLQAQKTYIVKVKAGESQKQQSLTISFTPSSAIVLIDGKKYPSNDGKVVAMFPVGKHDFIVAADGYESYEGAIVLRETAPGSVEANLIKSADIEKLPVPQNGNVNTKNNTASSITQPVNNTNPANSQYILDKVAEGKRLRDNKDYTEAYKCFQVAAEAGNAEAQYRLGLCYGNGEGITQDYVEGIKWYKKAAEQGYASAQNNLGNCYFNGRGVTKDYAEALKWYRMAAEQGNASAYLNLGACYFLGRGVKQNYTKAFECWQKAAELADVSDIRAAAQKHVGMCYEFGRGVEKDKIEALEWYKKAAEQGNEDAKKKVETYPNW